MNKILASAVALALSSSAAFASRRSGGKKSRTLSVDMTDVEASGGRMAEGDYLVEVVEVTEEEGRDSKEPYLKFVFEVTEGEYKGRKLYHNCSLQKQALFNLRSVLESLGVEIPKGAMDIDLDELAGMTCGAAVQNEKYEGKERPRIVEFFPASELEEEKPEKAGKSSKKKDDDEEPASSRKKKTPEKVEFEKGDEVKFEDEGKEYTGIIKSIDGDNANVKVGKDLWEIGLDELTKVE